jgi:hypothetical protein
MLADNLAQFVCIRRLPNASRQCRGRFVGHFEWGKQWQTRLIAATIDAVVHFLSRAVWGRTQSVGFSLKWTPGSDRYRRLAPGRRLLDGPRPSRKPGENQVRARSGALYAGCRLHNRTDPTSEKVEPSCRASSGDVSAWQASDPSWRKSHLYNQPAAITGRRGPLWIAPTRGS